MKLTWYGKLVNMNYDCKTAQKNYKYHGHQWSKMNRRFQIFTDPPQPRIGFTRKLGEVIAQWLSSSAAAHSSLEHSVSAPQQFCEDLIDHTNCFTVELYVILYC